jgi:hypothetical protein
MDVAHTAESMPYRRREVMEQGRAMAQAVSRWPLNAEAWFRAQVIHVGFVVDKMAFRQVSLRILRFSPVSIIPPLFSIPIYHLEMSNMSGSASSSETSHPIIQSINQLAEKLFKEERSATLTLRSKSKCYLRIQSVPQREHHTSPLQRSIFLKPLKEIIAVCTENHTEHINTKCRVNDC